MELESGTDVTILTPTASVVSLASLTMTDATQPEDPGMKILQAHEVCTFVICIMCSSMICIGTPVGHKLPDSMVDVTPTKGDSILAVTLCRACNPKNGLKMPVTSPVSISYTLIEHSHLVKAAQCVRPGVRVIRDSSHDGAAHRASFVSITHIRDTCNTDCKAYTITGTANGKGSISASFNIGFV